MKFYYTVKTLKWFLLYRSDQYSLEEVSLFLLLTNLLDFALDPRNDEAGAKALEATIRNGCSPFRKDRPASDDPTDYLGLLEGPF